MPTKQFSHVVSNLISKWLMYPSPWRLQQIILQYWKKVRDHLVWVFF